MRWRTVIHVLEPDCFCWVSTLAYPTCFGLKDFVVVVVVVVLHEVETGLQ